MRADKLQRLQGRRAAARAWCTPPPTPRSSACIDADYVVQPDWLKDLVPLFARSARRPGAVAAGSPRRRPSVMHHAMNAEYAGFFDIGMVQRNEIQRHHRARHDVPDPPRRARGRRRLVERHHLRGHRSRAGACSSWAGTRITPTSATATACCPTPSRPTRNSVTAGPMAASRSSSKHWRRFLPGREPAHPRPEARIRARLAQLARRREHRRRGRHPQHHLGAGRRLRSTSRCRTAS